MNDATAVSSKATLVVTASPDPDEMPAVQAYLQGVMPLLVGAGGELVKRLKVSDVINGESSGMVLVMDFDSAGAINDLFESEDYSALIPVRDKGFKDMSILVAGEL